MDSSVLLKDQIWFLRVCHHVSNVLYTWMMAVKGFASGGHFGLVDEECPWDVLPWILCKMAVKKASSAHIWNQDGGYRTYIKHLVLGCSPAVADSPLSIGFPRRRPVSPSRTGCIAHCLNTVIDLICLFHYTDPSFHPQPAVTYYYSVCRDLATTSPPRVSCGVV